MTPYAAIFIGGGLGAMSRYAITAILPHKEGSLPYSTLLVNILGAFLIGVLVEYGAGRGYVSENFRFFAITGFLGGFTTFSAFSLESANMWARGDLYMLATYVVLSVFGTILAVHIGQVCLRSLL